jgi:hypothetical protein
MAQWSQKDVQKHMHVLSADNQDVGHVAEVYEDSFLIHKGYFFPKDRYIPYSAIATISDDDVHLTFSADEAKDKEWEIRPAYEKHPGDPLQHFYDRGHGIPDPFSQTNNGTG